MIDELADRFYIRQRDILNVAEIIPTAIIGCGASGSGLGIQLAKLGVPMLTLYDGDEVEEHNLPNQYYPNDSIGENKAIALRGVIESYTPRELLPMVIAHDRYFNRGDELNAEIVFMAVDGLDKRQVVFNVLCEYDNVKWVIDTRMGAEYYEVYSVDMNDEEEKEKYKRTLEGEAMALPCTGRSVIYNVMGMSSNALSMFKKILSGERLPFMVGYDMKNYIQIVDWREPQELIRL